MKLIVTKSLLRILVVGLVLTALVAAAIYAIPEGATVITGKQETRTAPPVNNVTADAGNITEINISASTQTMAGLLW